MIIQSRRNFIIGLTSAIAAPAIVRADSLMKVKSIVDVEAIITGKKGLMNVGDIVTFGHLPLIKGSLQKFVITYVSANEFTFYPKAVF